ncbi:MAG: hypothetical protein NT069_23170, partial [Planctomycetota bacterium]|nr:hypothetical protein [Planctomycetota bacterium]
MLNSGLFSSHWLSSRLRLEPEWADLRAESNAVLAELVSLWRTERTRVEQYQGEQALEYGFIQPVLEAIGWKANYQTFLQGRKPDYALFLDDAKLDAALRVGGRSPEFWNLAAVVADSKAWGSPLDRRIGTLEQREIPPQQMEWYLDRSRLPCGILTNGNQWRLIPRERQPFQGRFDTFFEVRLCDILDRCLDRRAHLMSQEMLEDDFEIFYLLFSPRGFTAAPGTRSIVDRAATGSSEYRLGIGDDLRIRAFDAVRLCIQGLLAHRPNALSVDTDLERCRQQSFTLVYRLLFILYAEDRGLLPYRSHDVYTRNRSLGRFRDEIHSQLGRAAVDAALDYEKNSVSLWSDLISLFDLVDRGNARYGVPAYNGGLFDPEEHPFWQEKSIPDWYLARVIHKLGHAIDPTIEGSGEFRVDYRDLAIQHLGGVYESLLELQPKVAHVPMLVIRKRTKEGLEERIVTASAPLPSGFQRTDEVYEKGVVYLETNKGERRASGSYYTPDHIVNHIIENTLGPLCRQIAAELEREVAGSNDTLNQASSDMKRPRANSLQADFDERILKLRVLDPAMGSGHFLLRACSYLAEQIATHPYARDESVHGGSNESAVLFWKRKVAENCIFGVDLNGLAVELAKLALWLETVAANEPLTFLNHHLRVGNSLLGPSIDDLGRLPEQGALQANLFSRRVKKSLPQLLTPLAEIRELASDSVTDVKRKQQIFCQFERHQRSFRRLAAVWCTAFLPREVAPWSAGDYERALGVLDKPNRFEEIGEEPWFQTAEAAARKSELHGFSWELEFPDVFFEQRGRLKRPGFDAIIGNPPYDVLSEA